MDNPNDDGGDDLLEVIYLGGSLDNAYDIYEEDDFLHNPNPPDYTFSHDVAFRLVIDSSITVIDKEACWGFTMLTEVVFHENVTQISYGAFNYCTNLQHIELPEGLLRVNDWAFHRCQFRDIVIPPSVQFIGNSVFRHCKSLQRIIFTPRTHIIELGHKLFFDCTTLQSITLPQNLQLIPEDFFYCCDSLTKIQIPASVVQIGKHAFCSSAIQSITISDNDNDNDNDVSEESMSVMLPPNLQSIEDYCFFKCRQLTDIRIPLSVKKIGDNAFSSSGLRSIVISDNIHEIGPRAFRDCPLLKQVTFHHSTSNLTIADGIFANCSSLSVIMIYQWLWPKLFASMNGYPDFIFKFFKQYQTHIFYFEIMGEDVAGAHTKQLRRNK